MRRLAILLTMLLLPGTALAVSCRNIEFEQLPFSICEVARGEDLRLWLDGPDGSVLGGFDILEEMLAPHRLVFAMNGGMYHEDRKPVGLFIEQGKVRTPAAHGGGYGNYGMLPNGIFCIGTDFRVWESDAFASAEPACAYATQSGPMLVIGGELHPAFRAESTSVFIRNGVGTSADGGRAVFAISNWPVNFHTFARLFRDGLGLPDALFLDANVSRLFAPELGRADAGPPVGPIIGVVDGEDSAR
jgi:uncharacterized protein YigE (DUF2233 family)